MRRRYFFLTAAGAAVRAVGAPSPVKVTRISLTAIDGRFHRFVAMNSYDTAPKGHTYSNTLIRIATDQGIEGIGVLEYAAADAAFQQAVRELVGANPLEVYEMSAGRISGRNPRFSRVLSSYQHLDGPLYDLIGKLTRKPAWQLIGPSVRDRVEVYDGTLYFSDIWFRDRGVRAVVEETEEALKSGYVGMKYKVGRGWKWMETEAGLKRDIEVIQAVRAAAGRNIKIMADANNGFQKDFERGWRFLNETANTNLYWMEELFPEDVALYAKLHDRMDTAGMKTFVADGENLRKPDQFKAYLTPRRLMDVVQMDIRRGGFIDNVLLARMAEEAGAISVPHNWGAQVGMYMGLHLAKAVKSVPAAEDDRSTCDVLQAEGYTFQGGYYTVSNAPGLGLSIDQKAYHDKYQVRETVIS